MGCTDFSLWRCLLLQSAGYGAQWALSCRTPAQWLWHTGLVAPQQVESSQTSICPLRWRQILILYPTREILVIYFKYSSVHMLIPNSLTLFPPTFPPVLHLQIQPTMNCVLLTSEKKICIKEDLHSSNPCCTRVNWAFVCIHIYFSTFLYSSIYGMSPKAAQSLLFNAMFHVYLIGVFSLYPMIKLHINLYLCILNCFSCVQFYATLWTVACQDLLSMGFPRQEYWSGLPHPSHSEIETASLCLLHW